MLSVSIGRFSPRRFWPLGRVHSSIHAPAWSAGPPASVLVLDREFMALFDQVLVIVIIVSVCNQLT